MSQSSETDFAGRCPICRKLMVEMGALVVCPKGHYRAKFFKWDARWKIVTSHSDAESLMRDLLAMNLVDVAPDVIAKFHENAE